MKPLETPVAFIIFNRPDTTERVFNEIRKAKPKKLFVISDGPRNARERVLVEEARKVIDRVDWDCEVQKNYSDTNLGCKKRMSSGITWFFEHVEEGIILEDDCVPAASFFPFCEELLRTYRNDERVMMITGDNFLPESLQQTESYYFSRHSNIWGWATWRRAWKHYDVGMRTYPEFKKNDNMHKIWKDPHVAEHWMHIFDRVHRNKVDTWDYQWVYAIWNNNGMSIVPRVNLISNIGFDDRATHTKRTDEPLSNLPTEEITFPLSHPTSQIVNMSADEYLNRNVFKVKKPQEKGSILKKLWATSPQALFAKVRTLLRVRKAAHAVSAAVEVESGYAKGVQLWMPSPIPNAYESMVDGTYEEFIIEKLQERTAMEGKVVWDVGAHFGYQSFSFARVVGKTGTVVAFEPNPHNVVTFRKNLELNPELAKRISLQSDALADKDAILSFNISQSENDPTTTGGYFSGITPPLADASYASFSQISVHATTADDLVAKNTVPSPDIIKIDVEGAELQVLKGAVRLLKTTKPIFVIEIHSLPMMFYIQELLKQNSYTIEIIDEEEDRFTKTILAIPHTT